MKISEMTEMVLENELMIIQVKLTWSLFEADHCQVQPMMQISVKIEHQLHLVEAYEVLKMQDYENMYEIEDAIESVNVNENLDDFDDN